MKHISEPIDDILTEWAYRVNDGMPDVDNPLHMAQLEHSLFDLEFPGQFVVEFMSNLREEALSDKEKEKAHKMGLVSLGYGNWGKEKGGDTTHKNVDGRLIAVGDEKEPEKEKKMMDIDPKGGMGDDTDDEENISDLITTRLNSGNLDGIKKAQNDLQEKRDKGISGAGGPVASQGESIFVKNVNTLNYDDYKEQHSDQIEIYAEKIRNRKLKVHEKKTIEALGLSEDGGIQYLAAREHFAQEELSRIKEDSDSVFYKPGKTGFNGKDKPYLEWCTAAFDGAIETKRILQNDTNIDTSQPHTTVQSEKEIDDAVEKHLKEQSEITKSPEDKEYYEKELRSFKKFREYHDTFVIGKDENGRTSIVSISNKKGDDLKDPHSNTTPASRLKVIKERYGEEVAKKVTDVIEDGIIRVSDTKQSAVKRSSELSVDDDLSKVCKTEEMSNYINKLGDNKKFREWASENNYEYDKLSMSEKLKLMQSYSKMLIQNGKKPAYEPFGKIMVKVGEFTRTKKFRENYPDINYDSQAINDCIDIKQDEKDAVSKTHKMVVNEVTSADKKLGYPKDEKNGPHTMGYIDSVFDALHFNTYIDGGDGKMIIQMGINGAQPKHIRNCLKELSGFTGEVETSGGREQLKNYIREKCKIIPDTGAVHIDSPDGKLQLADDTWRTAGTSQKVASGFGGDMRECVIGKASDSRKSE